MTDVIWKYCDYWKFQGMVEKGFHFRRSDRFADPFEGHFAWGPGVQKFMNEKLRERNSMINRMPGYTYLLMKLQEYERKRKSVYISCWQNDDFESEAMWRLYTATKNNEHAPAIVLKTSITKLRSILRRIIEPYALEVNPVEYLASYASEDYSDTSNSIFFKKRKSFEYEKEVRAVFGYKRFSDKYENDENLFFPVDMSELIDEIRISPFLGSEFMAEVTDYVLKHGIRSQVRVSEIQMQPEITIEEVLTSLERGHVHLGENVEKHLQPIDSESAIITERYDDIKKVYKVKLNKR